jgi:hypothetical protein
MRNLAADVVVAPIRKPRRVSNRVNDDACKRGASRSQATQRIVQR